MSFKLDSNSNIKLTSCEISSSQISAEVWTGLICARAWKLQDAPYWKDSIKLRNWKHIHYNVIKSCWTMKIIFTGKAYPLKFFLHFRWTKMSKPWDLTCQIRQWLTNYWHLISVRLLFWFFFSLFYYNMGLDPHIMYGSNSISRK